MNTSLTSLVLATIATMLGGCMGTRYQSSVNAFATSDARTRQVYILIPGNEDVESTDLEFQEFAGYLHRALEMEGFTKAASESDAEVVIVATYMIGDPQSHTYTYSVPHWGQTGYSSATTYGTVQTYGNYGTYSGTTYYQPKYGITGYSTGVGEIVTYTRVLHLAAFDAQSVRAESTPAEVWRTTVVSTGTSGDLRQVFPYLVAAGRPYLGRATEGKAKVVELSENDRRVRELQSPQDQSDSSR